MRRVLKRAIRSVRRAYAARHLFAWRIEESVWSLAGKPGPRTAARRPERKTVLLFLTHVFDDDTAAEYSRLRQECEGRYDVRLLYNESGRYADAAAVANQTGAFGFDPGEVRKILGTHCGRDHVQTLDLVVMRFHLRHPRYERYWLVEYDVRFSGRWTRLFDSFADNDADLLGTTIQRYPDCPNWPWWHTLKPPQGMRLPDEERIRSFLPCGRLSSRGLEVLRKAYRAGWRGQTECSVPTILSKYGCRIEDIGGNGEFVAPGNENRFYTNRPNGNGGKNLLSPGSFAFRPVRRRAGRRKDTLWHPVKGDWATAAR